ncbi:hypothetical protein ACHAWO_005321 [Cyclotella atomus]|uniref:DUF6824 domain-containing protein n=1 Tax=Cyclotella atomus TaxID=382360 RepID=A0ABD3QWU7_9STRA
MFIKPVINPQSVEFVVGGPTNRDVINGKGQGMQKLPGNIKFRKLCAANKASSSFAFIRRYLIFMHIHIANFVFFSSAALFRTPQELYARRVPIMSSMIAQLLRFCLRDMLYLFCQTSRCPEDRKLEVSRGIVHAVKNLQGRFLERDDTTGLYFDIGEEKAMKKTRQALREGQSKIKLLFRGKSEAEEAMPHTPQDYFAYSVHFLSALYAEEKSTNKQQVPVPPLPSAKEDVNNDALSIAVQNALDQFPMASQSMHLGNYMSKPSQLPRGAIPDSTGRYSDMSMSMASLSSEVSDIHTISSGQSSNASIPKDSLGT